MSKPERVMKQCLTVGDLIQLLKHFQPDLPVFFEHPAHDYIRSRLAGAVEAVEPEGIEWSDHHESFKVQRGMGDAEAVDVVILR